MKFSVFVSVLWDFRLNCHARSSKGLQIQSSKCLRMVFHGFFLSFSFRLTCPGDLWGCCRSRTQRRWAVRAIGFLPFSQHFKTTAVVYISRKNFDGERLTRSLVSHMRLMKCALPLRLFRRVVWWCRWSWCWTSEEKMAVASVEALMMFCFCVCCG